MKVVVVSYTDREPDAYPVCLDSVFRISTHCSNTLETFLDHRRHDWFNYGSKDIPKRTDVLINLYSRKHELFRFPLAIKTSTVVLNPRSSHKYIRYPNALFTLLDKLGIDHPRVVSSRVVPATLWSAGGNRDTVLIAGREPKMGPDVVRTEVPLDERRFRVWMAGNTPYFLDAYQHVGVRKILSYEHLVGQGIRVVRLFTEQLQRLQRATKLIGLVVEFCMRGDTMCVLSINLSMGLHTNDITRIKKYVSDFPKHARKVRDLLAGDRLSFDMFLVNLRQKRSLIIHLPPGKNTLKTFLQVHFRHCYTFKHTTGEPRLVDRHNKDCMLDGYFFVICVQTAAPLVPTVLTQQDYDAAIKTDRDGIRTALSEITDDAFNSTATHSW
jgi:hypothetical protein